MKKILLFLLVLSIIKCDNNYNKEINLIDLVPTNPVLLVKYESSNKINVKTINKSFNTLINHQIDSISERFLDKPLLISYHNISKNNLQSILFTSEKNILKQHEAKDSLIYNGFIIKKEVTNNIEFFSTVKNGVYIESKSKLLVENSLRNSNYTATIESRDLKKLYNISNSNTTLFISDEFPEYLKNPNLYEIFKEIDVKKWMQYDIELNKKTLTINGVGIIQDSIFSKINIFKNIAPSKSNINKIVPINFKKFKRVSYEHSEFISVIKNEVSINELKKIINDSLFYDVYGMGLIELEKDTISTYSFKNNTSITEKIKNNLTSIYRGNKIYQLNSSLFKTKNKFNEYYNSKIHFGTVIEDILILSKKKSSIENIILNFKNNSTLKKSSKFNKAYENIPEKNNQLNIYNLNNFENSLFDDLKLKREGYNFWISHLLVDENFIFNSHRVEKLEKETNTLGPKIISNIKLKHRVYLKPKWVINYVTNEKEIVVQDNKNNLYLITNDGEIVWKKDLESKIIGEIFQIDLYKNGRLQYAFNTTNSFLILDKKGEIVKKIDHKKNAKVLGLSVFDYDKNKKYRFLICYNNQVKMLDSKMKIVRGFNKNNIKHKITNAPKHFRIGSKDYLIFNTEKKLYITDRRGNDRIKVSENLNISGKEIYKNKNSLITIDNNNNLIRIDLNGKTSKSLLPLETKYLISANNNNSVYLSENTLSINQKNIEIKYGKYSKPIILSNNMIQITNLDESKLYLFKNEGSIVPYFPIFGSSSADITKNKDDKKMIVVQGDENEILVYSFK